LISNSHVKSLQLGCCDTFLKHPQKFCAMITENAFLSDLHFEHKLWINELNFFEDEINTFENRLEELARQHLSNREVMVDLERFQNQFIRQKEVINDLKSDIRRHEHHISEIAAAQPDSAGQPKFQDHTFLRERMETFRKLYGELKSDFFRYAVKWI
jgi:predicted  nucleic acid-binding Zn-ribbon protein